MLVSSFVDYYTVSCFIEYLNCFVFWIFMINMPFLLQENFKINLSNVSEICFLKNKDKVKLAKNDNF